MDSSNIFVILAFCGVSILPIITGKKLRTSPLETICDYHGPALGVLLGKKAQKVHSRATFTNVIT